jgi:dihydroorotase
MAVDLAKKNNTRLHILHISTEEELALFETGKAVKDKKITAEVCVHHLWFDASQYDTLGNQIKCNPAIKDARHKTALRKALVDLADELSIQSHIPAFEYCTDNAAMIAIAAHYKYLNNDFAPQSISPSAR